MDLFEVRLKMLDPLDVGLKKRSWWGCTGDKGIIPLRHQARKLFAQHPNITIAFSLKSGL